MGNDIYLSVFTLLMTALVSGLLVPAIMKNYELSAARKFELKKTRNDMQLALLDRLTRTIWTWRFLAKEITYYGSSDTYKARYEKAVEAYEEKIWTLSNEIKSIKSQSIVWFPEWVPPIVEDLYGYVKDIDQELMTLVDSRENGEDTTHGFAELAEKFSEEVSNEIEKKIYAVTGKTMPAVNIQKAPVASKQPVL